VSVDPRLATDVFWSRLADALERVPDDVRRPPPGARVGAVLVLLEEAADGPQVVITRRRRDLRSHPGQLSFPGGRLDPGEGIEDAALREASEEVGLDPASVEVVGTGPVFYIPPSRFWVVPVLGRWRAPHPLRENPWEVDEVLRVPLVTLLDRQRLRYTPVTARASTWAWQLDEDLLWGATAVVMGLLLDVVVEGWSGVARPGELGPDREVRPWETVRRGPRPARLEAGLPEVTESSLPHVDAAATRAMRAWLDARGLGPVERAEQAGRAVAHAVRRLLGDAGARGSVTVLAGPSSNGTVGLVAARLLAAAGHEVDVLVAGDPRDPRPLALLAEFGVRIDTVDGTDLGDARAPGAVVVDALLGIGASPPLRDLPRAAADWLKRHDVPVVAVDLPSGVAADTGPGGACITADVTVTLGLPSASVALPLAQAFVGDLYVADLGVPARAWEAIGVTGVPADLFARGPLVRLVADMVAGDAGTPDQGRIGEDDEDGPAL
jgi:hydroxyethylthiazole kinase-like uncharacterized protein yjeF